MAPSLSDLEITSGQMNEILEHARRQYPLEDCGLLAGKGGRIERVFLLENIEPSRTSFLIAPEEQLRVFRQIEDQGWELSAIYHSHPQSPAYPSRRDIDLAFYPDSLLLIVSLADFQTPQVRAFQIQEGRIRERTIHVRERDADRFR